MKRTPLTLPAADGRGVVVVVLDRYRTPATLNHRDEAALRGALEAVGRQGRGRGEGTP